MIAIKDMEMPSCCRKCPYHTTYIDDSCGCDLNINITLNYENRPSDCPLIEIEQTDDLVKQIEFGINATGHTDEYTTGFCNALIWLKSYITREFPDYFEVPVTPTHGTCKDCNNREDCFIDTDDDFYCRDFKRREENEVN